MSTPRPDTLAREIRLPRVLGRRVTPAVLFAGSMFVLVLVAMALTAPCLRVAPASAHTWMLALDERIARRIRDTLPSGETFDTVDLHAHHDRALQAKELRMVLLAPAALRLQVDLLSDIAALARANDSCAPYHCDDVTTLVTRLTDARTSSDAHAQRVDRIMSRTPARPAYIEHIAHDSTLSLANRPEDAAERHAPPIAVVEGEAFDDVLLYQATLWDIIDLHADLTEEYHRRHRLATLLMRLADPRT